MQNLRYSQSLLVVSHWPSMVESQRTLTVVFWVWHLLGLCIFMGYELGESKIQ